jgi:hypothetical protein
MMAFGGLDVTLLDLDVTLGSLGFDGSHIDLMEEDFGIDIGICVMYPTTHRLGTLLQARL